MLHELVSRHAQTLIAELRDADGCGLPRYVDRELALIVSGLSLSPRSHSFLLGFRVSPRSRGKLRPMPTEPIATIASQTASLTIAVFDASTATEWVQTKAAATKAQFTGHPAEIMRGLSKGEDVAAFDVGASAGYAFELEGKSGRIEIYRTGEKVLALVAPPRAWWIDPAHHGAHVVEIDALFADALAPNGADDATEVGELTLSSGKLAVIYMWHKKVGAARELATTVPSGGALAFGDGYGTGEGGVVVDVGPSTYRLLKRELQAPWDADQSLAIMYIVRDR